jgi:predicted dehydrogenase
VWGVRALQAGKHLMMQKPLCADMAEAESFVAAVERSDRIAMCLPHFGPEIYAMRAAIQRSDIGRVSGARSRTSHGGPEVYYREVRTIFGEEDEEEDDLWFFDAARADAGALFDMGVYAVSNLIALLGTITHVRAVAGTFDKPTVLEDSAILLLRAHSGAFATAETSWCDPARTWETSVHGTGGKLAVREYGGPVSHSVPLAYDSDNAPVEERALAPHQPMGSAHQYWLDCIESGMEPPLSNAHAARHVTEVLLAGLESARTGCEVAIQSTLDR